MKAGFYFLALALAAAQTASVPVDLAQVRSTVASDIRDVGDFAGLQSRSLSMAVRGKKLPSRLVPGIRRPPPAVHVDAGDPNGGMAGDDVFSPVGPRLKNLLAKWGARDVGDFAVMQERGKAPRPPPIIIPPRPRPDTVHVDKGDPNGGMADDTVFTPVGPRLKNFMAKWGTRDVGDFAVMEERGKARRPPPIIVPRPRPPPDTVHVDKGSWNGGMADDSVFTPVGPRLKNFMAKWGARDVGPATARAQRSLVLLQV
ncbi:hypothetical protein CF319_g4459 [Tilletia indica]|uniref:Uncharacterized protein n=1 Tax=Tilletia indica TaxID=43049 RepID=A0A177TBB0_9BASI|nr:hypothetical protein CF319_g4459 [Tilletia indica]KAE8234379.1 hypothetical protein CF326_g581 [Tilletia indica]KAE8255757.1 hypothetical protein A4X13_0g2922 [Tilletia indica]